MTLDIDCVTNILATTAAEEVRPRFRALATGDVREKTAGDFVTVADETAERVLSRRLSELLPGSLVLGEEAAAEDPKVLYRLTGDSPVWVIDPVDGTGNFARGIPTFAVMLALVQNGETRAAWIHEPLAERMTVATVGGGAWENGRQRLLLPAPPANVAALTGTFHVNTFGTKELIRQIDKRRNRVSAIRSLRCAGAEYTRMARGEQHFSIFTKLAPWDHAPGTLILREAGGVARLTDGRPYTPLAETGVPLLLAPTEASWNALFQTMLEKHAGTGSAS